MGDVQTAARRSRRPPQRFPRAAVRILEQWLLDNRTAPYATQHQQDELKIRTGLKRSQIMNWFANARKRGKLGALQSSSSSSRVASAPLASSLFSQIANLHPFERWLHLGLEQEAASPSAIREAVARAEAERGLHDRPHILPATAISQGCGTSTNWQYFRKCGSSVSSLEIRSYAANIRSVCSDQWKCLPNGPPLAIAKSARRHRRLDIQKRSEVGGTVSQDSSRKYQCSFCNDCFKRKHDWQRHEKSQHLPLEKWTCCPQGSVNVNPTTYEITCVFCGAPDPDPEHLRGHGYPQCMSRAPAERTFYRKDHLRQHLRLMHFDCPMTQFMESWKSSSTALRSRCGFCSAELETWEGRVEHLAEHFQGGARMEAWEGDWGFDEASMAILERATLPSKRLKQEGTIRGHFFGNGNALSFSSNTDRYRSLDSIATTDDSGVIDEVSAQQWLTYTDQQLWDTIPNISPHNSSFLDSLDDLDTLCDTFYGSSGLSSDGGIMGNGFVDEVGVQNDADRNIPVNLFGLEHQLVLEDVDTSFDAVLGGDYDLGNDFTCLPGASFDAEAGYPDFLNHWTQNEAGELTADQNLSGEYAAHDFAWS